MEDIEFRPRRVAGEAKDSLWKRRWKIILPLLLSMAALISILAWGMLNQSSATSQSGAGVLGEPAPNFTVSTFSGETFDLADYRGSPVIINFWASWCGPCRIEAPELEQAWRRFGEEGVVFIGVNVQDFDDSALSFIEEFNITYPNGPDEEGLATIDYGVGGIPVTFFIDQDGMVARRFVGSMNQAQLSVWINELNDGSSSSGDVEAENLDDFFEFNN